MSSFRPGGVRRRSRKDWTVRLGVAAIAALCAYHSLRHTLASILLGSSPELAHSLAPYDGRISALLSQNLSRAEASRAERAEADRLAREALLNDPVAVEAVTTLGINADLRGDAATARHALSYAQGLSRRDLRLQLWAIEDAVAANDIPAAVRNYDIALRTSRRSPELMFPVLSRAIGYPTVRDALTQVLTRRPLWGGDYIRYVARNGPDPRATLAFFRQLRQASVPFPDGADAQLISALILKGLIEEAWDYYSTAKGGLDRRFSRDPHFGLRTFDNSPFDWVASSTPGIATSIGSAGGRGVFDFALPSSVGGTLLLQMEVLPPGRYVLTSRGSATPLSTEARPYLRLVCRDGRELTRISLAPPSGSSVKYAQQFRVPEQCAAQYLALVAPASDSPTGLSGQIDEVLVSPL